MPNSPQFDELDSRTPIARELKAFLERGGSPDGAVALVAGMERAFNRLPARKTPEKSSCRGTRLTADWQPSQSDTEFAIGRGLHCSQVAAEAEKFRNYWLAKGGQAAAKRDWPATWRNWIIAALERHNGRLFRVTSRTNLSSGSPQSGSDAVLAGVGKLSARVNRSREPTVLEGREVQGCPNPPLQLTFDSCRDE
jgi:hypothetical protein